MALEKKIRAYSNRINQIRALFDDAGPFNRVLYVGAQVHKRNRRKPPNCLMALKEISQGADCLEIFQPYIPALKKKNWFDNIYCGDICDGVPAGNRYDLICWWHGPEHVEKERLLPLLKKLPTWAPCVWMACQWGAVKQNAMHGNVHEEHASYLYEEDFCDYNVIVSGKKDRKKSQIIAWNYKKVFDENN